MLRAKVAGPDCMSLLQEPSHAAHSSEMRFNSVDSDSRKVIDASFIVQGFRRLHAQNPADRYKYGYEDDAVEQNKHDPHHEQWQLHADIERSGDLKQDESERRRN